MAGKRFSTGEIVQLKSGGPPMLVEAVLKQRDEVQCSWMNEGVVIQKIYPKETVERARDWRKTRQKVVKNLIVAPK